MTCDGNCVCNCVPTGRTLIGVVIDESGSMFRCAGATISGFNEFLQTQKRAKAKDEVLVTLTKFHDLVSVVYSNKPLDKAPELNSSTYSPGGSTALYDAVARTVREIEKEVKAGDRVLFLIITDGQENASKESTKESIVSLVKSKESLGNWTFTYMGANQDAWSTGIGLGIPQANSINYVSTAGGTTKGFNVMSNSTLRYRGGNSAIDTNFYGGTNSVDDLVKKESGNS